MNPFLRRQKHLLIRLIPNFNGALYLSTRSLKHLPAPSWSLENLRLHSKAKDSELSQEQVLRLARFAHLHVDLEGEEFVHLQKDVSTILRCSQTMQKLKAQFEEQVGHLSEGNQPACFSISAPFRTDSVEEGGDSIKILSNAAETEETFFVVPKVVEET
mmetsp:Transcript_30225/g.39848  ORF Transcript_30225/g.39848 Transcript_30225/m.39848 type:complete len:159 (-) Transcript_30225:271-747(-)